MVYGDYKNRWHKGWTNHYDLTKAGYGIQAVWHHKGSNVKRFDTTPPQISDQEVVVSSMTENSFKIRAKVTDESGIKEVGVNVWTNNNGQDDIKWRLMTKKGDYYEYTVYSKDHNNEKGLYTVHLYATDNEGNQVGYAYNAITMGTNVEKNLGDFTARIVPKKNTNYVMGTDGTNANGTAVVLKSKSNTDNSQLWKFTKQSDNTYKIINIATSKSLDVDGGYDDNGTKIQLYNDNSSAAQRFYIMNYNDGYRIVPKSTKQVKSLDINNGTMSNNNKIQLWETNSATQNAQTWKFEKVATGLTLNTTSAILNKGSTKTIIATITPSDAYNKTVIWTSSNTTVATVSSSGVVTAKKAGTTVITAKTNDGSNLTKQCTITVKDTDLPFKDVKSNDWYYEAVKYTYNNKMISGYNSTTFAPNDKLTRGMIVTILYRMEGSPSNNGKSKFTDVNSTEWYSQAIKWASDNGIVYGYTGTTKFGPNDNILRQDLAGILRNYAKYKNKNTNVKSNLSKFSDYKKIDNYANASMQWAVGTGVITGVINGNGSGSVTLNPKGTATRAEAAAMIQKYCQKVGR